jgi:hypothetical protein
MSTPLDSTQSERLADLIDEYDLGGKATQVRKAAQACVGLSFQGPSKLLPVGVSRIGGLPDLPPGLNYPQDEEQRYLLFVGQINRSLASVVNTRVSRLLAWLSLRQRESI